MARRGKAWLGVAWLGKAWHGIKEVTNMTRMFSESIIIKGYRINRWIIMAGMIPAIILIVYLAVTEGFATHFYYICNSTRPCENEYYGLTDGVPKEMQGYANFPIIPPGTEIGQKPLVELMSDGYLLIVFGLACAFGINHLIYNKKKVVNYGKD